MGLCGLQNVSTHPLITAFTTTLEELARHHYQHGKDTRQVLFQELYFITQRFSNEGTERTKQPDQALGAGRGRTRHGALASGPTSGSCSLGSCPLFSSLTEEKSKLRDVKGFSWDPHPQQGRVSTQLLFNDKTMMKQTRSETQRTSALGRYVDTMAPSAQGVAASAHKRPPGWTPQGRSWLKEGRATNGRLPRPCDHLEAGHQLP